MKKITLLAVAFVAISFASCKKNYTCECSAGGVVFSTTTIKNTKSKAKTTCEALSSNYTAVYGSGATCAIK